jgi:Tol biopolymer transport system component
VDDTLFVREADGAVRSLAVVHQPSSCAWGPRELLACASGNALYLTPGPSFGNLAPSRIVVVRIDDGAVHTVSDSLSGHQSPVWSADGRWLYYLSNRLGPFDVYAVPIARGGGTAGDPVRLTVGLGAHSFSLSPDGSRLAYALFQETANLWSLPLPSDPSGARAQPTQITTGRQVIENMCLSRDGQWLVYDSDLAGSDDIYRMRLPAGVPERITLDPSDDFAPDLSPDGRQVAFHSWRSGSRDIYVMPVDGGPVTAITASPLQEAVPKWSPDGTSLLYFAISARGGLYIARRAPDGTWRSALRHPAGWWPQWSPDGRFLSFTSGVSGSVLVIPIDSGPPRLLYDASPPGRARAGTTSWSADGRTVYLKTHDARGRASLWSVPASGGEPRLVLRLEADGMQSYRPEFMLAGGHVYFALRDRQSNVGVMDLVPR